MSMKCDKINSIIILAIVTTIIADFIALFAELQNQKCEKRSDQEREKKEAQFTKDLDDLRKRIAVLERNQKV